MIAIRENWFWFKVAMGWERVETPRTLTPFVKKKNKKTVAEASEIKHTKGHNQVPYEEIEEGREWSIDPKLRVKLSIADGRTEELTKRDEELLLENGYNITKDSIRRKCIDAKVRWAHGKTPDESVEDGALYGRSSLFKLQEIFEEALPVEA